MTGPQSKHAFLILAHRCDKTLDTLLCMLGDSRNDIFLHMDAKCSEYESETFARRLEQATLYSIPRRSDLCQDFGHGSSRNQAAIGMASSDGAVRSKKASIASAGTL